MKTTTNTPLSVAHRGRRAIFAGGHKAVPQSKVRGGCIAQWQSSGLQIHGSPVRIRLYPSFWIRDRSVQKRRIITISRKIQFLFTSFYCNGRSPARRQAWDHPKAALAWHLAKTCPFREIEDRISSHLHTTLNKSRDEKLIGACTVRIVLKRKRFTAPKRGCKKTSSEGLEPSISRFVVSRLIQLGHED